MGLKEIMKCTYNHFISVSFGCSINIPPPHLLFPLKIWAPHSTAMQVRSLQMESKNWLAQDLILLRHILTLFMTSLTQTIRHKKAALVGIFVTFECQFLTQRTKIWLENCCVCDWIPNQTWKPSVNVLLDTWLWLSGTHCRPTWELLPPSQLSKLT